MKWQTFYNWSCYICKWYQSHTRQFNCQSQYASKIWM